MMNIYDGVVILDQNGKAEVQLAEWFRALLAKLSISLFWERYSQCRL
jgi:hypothetical protein